MDQHEQIDTINKKTGRNMPQAIATGALLVAIILAALAIRTDVFVFLIVLFMTLGLWELRIDFATVGLHIPFVALSLCSAATMLATYYAPWHFATMSLGMMATVVLMLPASTARLSFGTRVPMAVARKLSASDASIRRASSFNQEGQAPKASRLANVGVTLFTVLYIEVLACYLIFPLTFGGHPFAHACMSVFLPALSDTGGLFFGAAFGKHKLSPRISPKKSYEGLAGSMLFAMAGAFAIFACTYGPEQWATRWWVPILAGVLVGLVGTYGDLCASLIKRDLGIKDMGHLLKGHGGVLDRVDSILMCAPVIALLLYATGL
ncbi:phosphatidate cytidylyltransferase [Bifidobacterium vespertilionis]|uniref:Phosphatidate cytidylyltransferase n=1 Tax=Bifidobacterium vespertilionis TaxID=2562524 RepID=A0A5J5E4W9_9BIFI|nr:phosphatidate cytidylyltransferase [Bifidobacterium vespertilionis]KAA8822547.1 phosphatidate cytidylyltransferase [Bifidobacterium vespertilionis]KAA8824168.1 phosphatidate cytidylyltransferase [Bifidobacterium vespertilionis]